jgi:hypothetical protein
VIIHFFDDEDPDLPFDYLTVTRWIGSLGVPYESALTANTYLKFAADDLAEGSERGMVNAFGNVKRCIHLSVDTLLHQYGLYPHAKRLRFPARLAILDRLGILPIKIMENLNFERNEVEHDYICPEPKRVQEAFDVARLIQLAIARLLEKFPIESVVGWKEPHRHVVMRVEPITGMIALYKLTAPGKYRNRNGRRYFSAQMQRFDGGKASGIKVASAVWHSIPLDKAHEAEWLPILKVLINEQRSEGIAPEVDGSTMEISFTMTIPIPVDQEKLSEILDGPKPR